MGQTAPDIVEAIVDGRQNDGFEADMHRAQFEQRYCRPSLTGGTSWICTWKCALWLWPHLPRFSNQMLR